ncbi:NFATC2-interacting protein-like [Liolophura sinensis]|uniref:NFATC2-interacting protein-like n=1 Tax=Liolophura sinensis TaxID=3198878 RepID=UPI003158D95D
MDNYISIPESDSDGEPSRETATCILISSDSGEEDNITVKGRTSRSRETKKGWSFLPQSLRNPRKRTTEATKPTMKKSMADSENVHPSEPVGQKHKPVAGSDSDTDDGAPVIKKPTKSRTFRRGLTSQSSIACQPTPLIEKTESSSIYSTRVSNCMNALRKGKLGIRVDLADSSSDNEEGGFIESGKQGRQPSAEHLTDDINLHDLSQNSPPRDDSQTLANRSPTPPPSPPSSPKTLYPSTVGNKLSTNVRNAIKFLHSPHLTDYTPLEDQDLIFDGEEPADTVRKMMVKVRSRSGIQRFSLKMTETFKRIFSEMAEHEGVKEGQIVMFRREESIRPAHTPESLSLHVADIIDCRIGGEADMNESLDCSLVENVITIFIQGKDSRSKTAIKMRKDDPLETGLQKYCKQSGATMETMSLVFDGDVVSVNQTPDDLDMEDGDCIDVITTGKKSKSRKV